MIQGYKLKWNQKLGIGKIVFFQEVPMRSQNQTEALLQVDNNISTRHWVIENTHSNIWSLKMGHEPQ